MGRRDRFQNRVRALFAPDAPRLASPTLGPPPSTQPTPPPPSSGRAPGLTTLRNPVLEKALAEYVQRIPDTEKAAFEHASKTIDEQTLLSKVRAYDVAHKDNSSFRPHADRLSKFLGLLNDFMGGVAIGIQASPEISAIVVGSVRIVIDLALKFTMFFSRLTDMICTFEAYLAPLAEYAKKADIGLVEEPLRKTYMSIVDFGWKARRVFVDVNGKQRAWTSFRAFLHQHWEPFESEFASIAEDLQHHLHVLLHSVQALHFNAFLDEKKSKSTLSIAIYTNV